ncbi:glycosyltransferase family 1 protein [Lottiidibacillus patelloidae]|uniref:Glycosyltransferase family 1 protein n=1 Tax=Lottiidibacillus patelloidae TaxID=2670334 RepID=A0A263BSU4_9BACI|nr:glycosyltransferase family 4 protein [Lottiidibacillus patelloidae]OZM56638.1 glycosyltransferase family 1 protein [Lottiidibacillus patelloidae]
MAKKKVLIAATVYTHLANFHIPTIKLLQEKGYEVHAASNNNEGRKNEIESLGVICHDIKFVRAPFKKHNIIAMKQISSLFKEFYFDLIHVHTPIASFIVRYIAKKYNQGPVLYTAHGFHFYKGSPLLNWLLYYPAERIAKRWTDALIVINTEDFNRGIKMGFIANKNLFKTNGVGVDLKVFTKGDDRKSNFRREINIPDPSIVITCVAEFTKNKNQQLLLKAWPTLINEFNNIHLVFVGDGKRKITLEKLASRKNLKNVYFLGFRHDIPEILMHSNIVSLVSKREGMPKTIMEGMAIGLPAIVSDVRGSRDLVNHKENGLIVKCDQVNNLIENLKVLIEQEEVRKEMGDNALKKVTQYSNENVLKELNQVYESFFI